VRGLFPAGGCPEAEGPLLGVEGEGEEDLEALPVQDADPHHLPGGEAQGEGLFLKKEDERAILDLMRRFSSATRYAYNRLLEGKSREELKRENGPLCGLFRLNTRYADGATEKVQAALDSAKELGQDPRKVVFGGRKLFLDLRGAEDPR
jgi:predicted transposase